MTDLAGTQLSNLLETLPGIAKVLRSPVADAIVALVKSASGQGPFNPADVDELLKFAVRRNLMTAEEADRILLEAKNALLGIMPPPPPPKPKVVAPPVMTRPIHHHVARPPPAKPVGAEAGEGCAGQVEGAREEGQAGSPREGRAAHRPHKK